MADKVLFLEKSGQADETVKPKKESEHDKTVSLALMHHNELKAYAKKNGQLKKDGTIDKVWLEEMASKDDVVGKRARLSITLSEMKSLPSLETIK